MQAPYPKSWWVEEGLLAGCYPGAVDDTEAKEKLQRLLNAGMRCFVSFQEPGEKANGVEFNPYIPLLSSLADEMGVHVECLNFPIRDNDVPDKATMRTILDALRKAMGNGGGVYVHCWGGHGRTGTVVGCWLRERGLVGKEALERIKELRRHDSYLALQEAPHTREQSEMVENWVPNQDDGPPSRAQGCLLGQLAGDSLGALVEFMTGNEIHRKYPKGVRQLADGGPHKIIAGQPTDDSEMALLLARMLVERKTYDANAAREAYIYWLNSGAFDIGDTISHGLRGHKKLDSQANGAMMRISPLGIFGANHDLKQVAEWARQDAFLTHPNPVCLEANALFTMAIAHAIRTGPEPQALYRQVVAWAEEMAVNSSLMEAVTGAADAPPPDYSRSQGWVLTAFRNALWQLTHAPNLEEGVVDTVMRGGDTDTNAAICGALLGAVYGREAIPAQWAGCILNCRPAKGKPNVMHPRPECFWPVDALELAERLLTQ